MMDEIRADAREAAALLWKRMAELFVFGINVVCAPP
jgi:hypothetical protein